MVQINIFKQISMSKSADPGIYKAEDRNFLQ